MTTPPTATPIVLPRPGAAEPSAGRARPDQDLLLARGSSPAALIAILDALPESAFLMDPDGTLLALNQTLAERLGRPRAALLGSNVYELLDPENLSTRRQAVAQVLETGQPIRFEDERGGRIIANSLNPVFDEFMLILTDLPGAAPVAPLVVACERLLAHLTAPYDLGTTQLFATFALGVAVYPQDGRDGETLMRNADTALHCAKQAGLRG